MARLTVSIAQPDLVLPLQTLPGLRRASQSATEVVYEILDGPLDGNFVVGRRKGLAFTGMPEARTVTALEIRTAATDIGGRFFTIALLDGFSVTAGGFASAATGARGDLWTLLMDRGDRLTGDNDTASGDRLFGGGGADSIFGDDGADTLDGGSGGDSIRGDTGADSLVGGADADTLLGGSGNDTIDAGTGDDTVLGDADADSLSGGAGADTIEGGPGRDTPRGGGEDDVFRLFQIGTAETGEVYDGGLGTDRFLVAGFGSLIHDVSGATVSSVEGVRFAVTAELRLSRAQFNALATVELAYDTVTAGDDLPQLGLRGGGGV